MKQEVWESIAQYIIRKTKDGETAYYEQWLAEQVNSRKSKKKEKPVVSAEVEEQFSKLWEAFPTRSQFDYKGKHYAGDRVLRKNKSVCLKLYNDCIQETTNRGGLYHAIDAILKALQVQLQHIKMESHRTGQNKMQYLNGLEVWLKQRVYESWLGQNLIPETTEEKVIDYIYNG